MNLSKHRSLSGDASFRKFYRNKSKIIVFSKKATRKNLLIYDAINKILIKNKIKAPKLISQNYKSKHIQIEDFGNVTVYQEIKKNNKKKLILQFKDSLMFVDEKIKIILNDNVKITGIFKGINNDGSLRLENNNKISSLYNGTIEL